MRDPSHASRDELLHELAEGLQTAGTYLAAAQRLQRSDPPPPETVATALDKAAAELVRA